MPVFTSCTAPLQTGLGLCLARSFKIQRKAVVLLLLKEALQRPAALTSARHTSQHGLFDAYPNRLYRYDSALASRRTDASISSCTSNNPLVRTSIPTQRSSSTVTSIKGLRAFHQSRRPNQHHSYHGSHYNSYGVDSFTLFYRSAQLAVLGTFLVVYLALQAAPDSNIAVSRFKKRQPSPTSTWDSVQQHLTSVRESIQKHLTYQRLSYRPAEWPPSTLDQCTPYVGSNFAHHSARHLASNSLGFFVLTSYLFPAMGVLATATTFLAGGVMASQIECAAANAYANPWNPWHNIVAPLHVSHRDPDSNKTLGASRLGASSGLCALFTVVAISQPFSRWRLLLFPVGVPVWMLWGGEVAWEGYSFYNNVDDGIGHGGHLAGHLAGAILWLAALRWTRYGKVCREISRYRM